MTGQRRVPPVADRGGTMLAMGFVFMLVHLLVLSGLHQRVLMAAVIEQRSFGGGSLPEPGCLVVVRALEDLRQSAVADGQTKTYGVSWQGTTYQYSVAFSETTSTWCFEVTPPATLPGALRFDRSVSWPSS